MPTLTIEKKKFTYEDYLKTPDDKRYELIEGELLLTPSPVTRHQRISRNIGFELDKFVRGRSLGEIFYAPSDVYLDKENVLQPDILFISKERLSIIGEKNIQGSPDLVVEILSESSAYRDLVKKKRLYAQFGVKEYWIVDPDEKTVEIFSLKDKRYSLTQNFTEKKILRSPLLSGLEIKLQEVFKF